MPRTFQHSFKKLCDEAPTHDAFIYYNSDMVKQSIQVQELFSLSARFAHILRKLGIKKGDVVASSLPLCLETVVINFGIVLSGAVAINCEATAATTDVFYNCLNKSGSKLLIQRSCPEDLTWGAIKNKVDKPKDGEITAKINDNDAPTLEKVVFIHRHDSQFKGQGFLDMLRDYQETFVEYDISEEDTCWLFMTSGSTGLPKVVIRSHRSLVEEANVGVNPDHKPTAPKLIYHNAPWSWLPNIPLDILGNYTRVQPDMWRKPKDPFKLFTSILKEIPGCTAFLTPPELQGIQKLWDVPDRKMVNTLLVAGYPVNKQLCAWLLTVADTLVIRYGSSEALCISYRAITRLEEYQDFDCGQLCEGAIVKSIDDNMEAMPKGKPGRLLVYTKGTFSGYMGDPDKTKEVLTEDGGFLGGDAGYVNDEGHLIVVGRYDYIIKHKNHVIYPSSIEQILREHPDISEVLVVPVPDDTNNHDNICACVVLKAGSTVSEVDLIKLVADKSSNGTQGVIPPHHVVFFDSFETNERGKVVVPHLIAKAMQTIKS